MLENNLSKYIDDFFNNLELDADSRMYEDNNGELYHHYFKDLLKGSIESFIEIQTDITALKVYEIFLMIYQITFEDDKPYEANIPLNFANLMLKYNNDEDLKNNVFIDSVHKFIIGLAIYSQNKNYRTYFEDYVKSTKYEKYYQIDGKFSQEEFLYRWGITALFHDIAFPLESMAKPFKKTFNKEFNNILNNFGESITFDFLELEDINSIPKIDTNFVDSYRENYPYSKFFNLFKPTDIMLHNIAYVNKFNLDKKQISMLKHNLNYIFSDEFLKTEGFIDHGIISGIIILNLFGYLIQKYRKEPELFFYPIVDSATAILLHNYYRAILQRKPFNLKELHPGQNPLAYLLILCDEIQEWTYIPVATFEKQRKLMLTNLFDIYIDDNRLEIEYNEEITNKFSLIYFNDKEIFLKEKLSIYSIFHRGLFIFTKETTGKFNRKITEPQKQAFTLLPLDIAEKIAIALYQQYLNSIEDTYELSVFEELSPEIKLKYFNEARSIPKQLDFIGYEIASLSDKRKEVLDFYEKDIVDLARYNHDRLRVEKAGNGWRYDRTEDVENHTTPDLLSWEELSLEWQELKLEFARNLPKVINSAGFKIVESKIKILTPEIHKFFQSYAGITQDFKDLPDHIKNSEFEQTDMMLEVLNEEDYSIIDENSSGNAISEYYHPIDYLARQYHRKWYSNKISLGWTYGDGKERTSPNLVPWNDLDEKTKKIIKLRFEKLPEICHDVGLKIIKN